MLHKKETKQKQKNGKGKNLSLTKVVTPTTLEIY
jgi:hypothetical protein